MIGSDNASTTKNKKYGVLYCLTGGKIQISIDKDCISKGIFINVVNGLWLFLQLNFYYLIIHVTQST